MKVAGSYHVNARREVVFDAICDPKTLMAVIPGCKSVEQVAPDEYLGSVHLRLPGAVGTYRTYVRLVDLEPPSRSGLEGRIVGGLGSITGYAEFTLSEAGNGTDIDYVGQAVINGPLARLDSRFAEQLAQSLIKQGLHALETRLPTEVNA
jgi:carbon monoxide dehydrogenase subunit G